MGLTFRTAGAVLDVGLAEVKQHLQGPACICMAASKGQRTA